MYELFRSICLTIDFFPTFPVPQKYYELWKMVNGKKSISVHKNETYLVPGRTHTRTRAVERIMFHNVSGLMPSKWASFINEVKLNAKMLTLKSQMCFPLVNKYFRGVNFKCNLHVYATLLLLPSGNFLKKYWPSTSLQVCSM